MIRSVVALFVFALLLCGYIVLRPGTPPRALTGDDMAVTRGLGDSILGPVPDVIASLDTTVVTPAPLRAPAPSLNVLTDNARMAETTANVLAGLGLNVAPTPDTTTADPMRDLTASVLSGIGQITGKQVIAGGETPAPNTSLEMLVVQALQQGQSDAYIDTIVNEAAKAGTITVPQGLVTANGNVDTAVLLYSLIEKARAAAGEPPLPPSGANEGVEFLSDDTEFRRVYTVGSGDSLGAIAIKFYGSVDKSDVIYQANRDVLSSPNAIQIGQRLAIPELAG